jgi:hypothetical protein
MSIGGASILWDLYQHYQIDRLDKKIDHTMTAARLESPTRSAIVHLEERADKLALVCTALFELMQESNPDLSLERLSRKVTEIDLRDGQADGRVTPKPQRCPKCEAAMSPRFGRCLFCGYKGETTFPA